MFEPRLELNQNSSSTGRTFNRSCGFWLLITISLIIIDQASKVLAGANIAIYKNFWFAFSLPLPIALIYFIYLAIFVAIVFYVYKNYRTFKIFDWGAWVLIIAGGVSNVGERLVLGYVRDFIPVLTGVLNLADFYIILGILILFIFSSQKNLGKNLNKT
jgi:lipoprotein signal peptidase